MGLTVGILIAVIAAIVVAVVLVVLRRSRIAKAPAPEPAPVAPSAPRPDPAPMTDLEAALAQVTDRSGRPIGESIDAEAHIVDELRDADDTGPLLGRALDAIDRSSTSPTPDDGAASDDTASDDRA